MAVSREMGAKATGAARGALVKRVNELYHDLQSQEFNGVHRHRHKTERVFWRRQVLPRLVRCSAKFGIDLCTGTGFVPKILLPGLPASSRIACLDISPQALGRASRELAGMADRVDFRVCDVSEIPLESGVADWVSLNAGLHHLPDPGQVLREVDRVLRRGGLFCLGHEPNQAFFSSPTLFRIERLLWHGFWYGSPSRNLKRVAKKLRRTGAARNHEHLQEINDALVAEGLVERALSLDELRCLVDTHTHENGGHGGKKGFPVHGLISEHFADYSPLYIAYTDYGGEMLRKCAVLRTAFDRTMNAIAPQRGRLFSWIIQKPSGNAG